MGAAGAVYMAVCALLWGVDTAVQALTARTMGAERPDRLAPLVSSAYVVAVPAGLLLSASLYAAAPTLMPLVAPAGASAAVATRWLRCASISVLFLSATLPLNAVWIGSGRTTLPALVALFGAPVQIGLALLLVPRLGGAGAALAMDASMGLAVMVQGALAVRLVPGFLRVPPAWSATRDVAVLAWPISAQQGLHQGGLVVLFAIVSGLGASSTAVLNVLVTVLDPATQIQTGVGVAAATLVGQALGQANVRGARRWGWTGAALAVAASAPMGLALLILAPRIASVFLRDPHAAALATAPLRIAGAACLVQAAATALGFSLRGAGATKLAALVPFLSFWGVLLPLNLWVARSPYRGILSVAEISAGVVGMDALLLWTIWSGSLWARVRLRSVVDPRPDPAPTRPRPP